MCKKEFFCGTLAIMESENMKTSTLLKRFIPYYGKYKHILILDLICAGLTSVCELVLPMIMRDLTNIATSNLAALTVEYVLRL